MDSFATIHQRALERLGGEAALAKRLPVVKSPQQLRSTQDDRWLAEMTRCVFQAGFVWRVVNQKWEGFEEVFFGFPPEKIVLLSPEQIDRFSQNPLIIRNRQKVIAVQHNARYLVEMARQWGSFGKFVAQWPEDDHIGLFAHLKKHGSRLGGMTGQRVLRNMGRDTFIITGDVRRCLQASGLDIADNPSSKRDLSRIQKRFNDWQQSSGLPYAHLSIICACSIDT
ncbi:DNA-3-methyladenine glycosylase I [Parahaliea sp. F7430]|uniref:DNA-3-methyladenine glycosylase I n=1 Tax=Sediminihaliea albiluteola TaxID=2758564 RepID=A0A7W2TUL3_9GAMM|nr:DNA-3-methyladenine glycosylase I [Sediminihaliea albiluteola]MBA6412223.1 DNA-3-methyladenine glycosylase I [Sediminihaliea albiluteola]